MNRLKKTKTLLEKEGVDVVMIKNHNYQLKAVDVPEGNSLMMGIYKFMVAAMFIVSKPLNLGHHQTLYCKKRN